MKLLSITLSLLLLLSTAYATEYIVKLKSGTETNFLASKAVSTFGEYRKIDVDYGNYLVLTTNNKSAMELLADNPNVEYIEPNQMYKVSPIISKSNKEYRPGDNMYGKQWGLENTGRNSGGWFSSGKKGEDINALNAWKITKGRKDVIIAVIDTGIDYNHADLKANILPNKAELNGIKGVDDDGNGFVDDIYGYDFANKDGDPMDGHGHGTHCAGVIGAIHNSAGIAGVMANVKLIGIKFLTDKGSGSTEGAIQSIQYAIKRGVNIMSNSWGGGEFSQALKDAIIEAKKKGILFVAAAGNEYNNNDTKPTYPATYKIDNVLTVGAHDGKGKKASFSNYGKKTVHVFAPGVNILSTVANNSYKKMSGTSMACPHVAGVMGLMLSHNPGIDYKDAIRRVIETSKENGILDDLSISKGRVDAYRMLENITN